MLSVVFIFHFQFCLHIISVLFGVCCRTSTSKSINFFPNKPWFLRVCCTSLLKTQWEKEKMPVTSIFSFSHSVFYSIKEINHHFSNFQFVICKCFQFGHVPNSVILERVNLLLVNSISFRLLHQ